MRPSAACAPLSPLTDYCTVLQRVAGKDASKQFWKYHNEGILKKYKGKLQVGSLPGKQQPTAQTQAPPTPPATPPASSEKKESIKPEAESGTGSVSPGPAAPLEAGGTFGELIPYSDPSWYQSVRAVILT